MNPFQPDLRSAAITAPTPRTGILSVQVKHNTLDSDHELEDKKKWGYYSLAGQVSQAINPHDAPIKDLYVRFAEFRLERQVDVHRGCEQYWRAYAVVAYLHAQDCEVGDYCAGISPIIEAGEFEFELVRSPSAVLDTDDFDQIWRRIR